MKHISFVILSLLYIAYASTDGFFPSKIQGPLQESKECRVSDEVRSILSQPFQYLSKGRQCFVFESRDGKYVLKFFNQNYLNMPWYGFLLGEKEKIKRERRRFFYDNSYAIAYKECHDEICYVHLSPTTCLPCCHVVDKAHLHYTLDLNKLPFVLQKKGISLASGIQAIYAKEGSRGVEREMRTFLELVSWRISKNIADADNDVEHNWGYVDGRLFHLDPGRLYYADMSEGARREQEIARSTRGFYKVLRKYDILWSH